MGGRREGVLRTLAAGAAALAIEACGGEGAVPPPPDSASPAAGVFVEATSAGLDFVHDNGMSGALYIAEVMGSGAGLLDYDNDGDLDLYLVQGGPLPAPAGAEAARDRLFRNDLLPVPAGGAAPRLSFTDVTAESGLPAGGYGMGVATGDFDNDGWIDLYVTNLGPNRLLRNNGDGTFADVTAAAGVDDPRWSASATFLDLDADGWLDLYVVNYVDFSPAANKSCRSLTGAPDYCGPVSYPPEPDRLFRNLGDGRFEDVTARSGAGSAAGAGLGVAAADFDADGTPEIYVANDGMPNFLWVAGEDGRYRDEALATGCALSGEGQAQAGMGLAVGDFDADADEDVLVTHLALEANTLYRNDGAGFFDDDSIAAHLASPSWVYTGFGAAWIDYDNDGWLDLAAVNGAVKMIPELVAVGDGYPLHMPNQLFRNLGGGRFEEVGAKAGEAFSRSEVSRGLAAGDVDNDGDVDLLLSNNRGPARLLLNRVGADGHWLGVRAVDREGGRDQLGAWVGVLRDRDPALWRRVRTGGSYLSASDPRLLFGLGDDPAVEAVVVLWPGGDWEEFEGRVDDYATLVRGRGRALAGRP